MLESCGGAFYYKLLYYSIIVLGSIIKHILQACGGTFCYKPLYYCHVNLVNMSIYIFVQVSVYVYMCKYVYVYEYDCFKYAHNYVPILLLYVLYDYVHCREGTVIIELRYIN